MMAGPEPVCIAVAYSGGRDSTALLHATAVAARDWPGTTVLALRNNLAIALGGAGRRATAGCPAQASAESKADHPAGTARASDLRQQGTAGAAYAADQPRPGVGYPHQSLLRHRAQRCWAAGSAAARAAPQAARGPGSGRQGYPLPSSRRAYPRVPRLPDCCRRHGGHAE